MSNSNNIYNILGKLAALTPKEETKQESLIKELHESVEAKGSVLEGVSAVEARLLKEFRESTITEKAVSKAQQKFMGMVHAAQQGEKAASPEVAKVAKSMGKKDARDFAATKHAGLPAHVDETGEVCHECGMVEAECGCPHTNEDAKPDFLDLDNDGNTDEPMKSAAKTHKTEKGEVSRRDGVTSHRRTDLPGYSSDDDEESEEQRSKEGKRGRPRKAQTKKPRPTGEKKGRGRPKKTDTGEKSSQETLPFGSKNKVGHDPFGRVKASAHDKGSKGKKIKGKAMSGSLEESMNNVARTIVESINFKKMMDETSLSLEEMIECLNKDMGDYKLTGNMSDRLRDFMHLHHHAKKQMEETLGNLPAAQVPGKQDLLKTPATPLQRVGGAVKDTLGGIKDFVTGKPENPNRPTYEEDVALESELNELARLAGLKVKEDPQAEFEGNAFGAQVNAKKHDNIPDSEQSIEIDGEELPVKEADIDVEEPLEPVNGPKKKYFSMRASTLAPGEGDNGEKQMHADKPTWKNGDNPLTLEARLAAEYESIKKVSK